MREEMEKMGLPAPYYQTDNQTSVTLENKIDERLEKYALRAVSETEEYTNLFPLEHSNHPMSRGEFRELRGNILTAIKDSLLGHGWFVDLFSFGRIIAHERQNPLPLSPQVRGLLGYTPHMNSKFGNTLKISTYVLITKPNLKTS